MAAQYIPIKRYNIQEDKIYGDPENKDVRYKILRISGNDIVYKNLKTDKVNYSDVNKLLEVWNLMKYKEVAEIGCIIEIIKRYLTPLIGSFLVGALIAWLLNKLGAK
jgi:hypothetical protein